MEVKVGLQTQTFLFLVAHKNSVRVCVCVCVYVCVDAVMSTRFAESPFCMHSLQLQTSRT